MRKTLMRVRLVGLCAVLALFVAGCSVTSAGLSPSTHPINDGNYTLMSQEDSSGSSFTFAFCGISLSEASTAKSRDRAIRNAQADALIDVTSENAAYFIGPISIYRIKVSGKPIKFM